jgi:hypothetical protein
VSATPTPLRYGNTGPDQVMILDANGDYVCSVQIVQTGGGMIAQAMESRRLANAALIVKAVNAYAPMLEALEAVVEGCEATARAMGIDPKKEASANPQSPMGKAYAALASAKGSAS